MRSATFSRSVAPAADLRIDAASVTSAFADFVRDEFSRRCRADRMPDMPPESRDAIAVDFLELARQLVACTERELTGSAAFAALAERLRPLPAPARMHALLASDLLGRKENRRNVSAEWYAERLLAQPEVHPPSVTLTAPGLPFRDQNPFRSRNPPDVPTLAEAAFLARLEALAQAVRRIAGIDLHVAILADGTLYAEALRVERAGAARYLQRTRGLVEALRLAGTVTVLDYRELAEDAARERGHDLWELVEAAERMLVACASDSDWPGRDGLRSLVSGVRWNVGWRMLGSSSPREIWGHLVCDPADHLRRRTYDAVSGELVACSIRYAAINVALRLLRPVERMLPHALRATVHPKPGQVGLPRLGSVVPWNGVALLDSLDEPSSLARVRVDPLFRLARDDRFPTPLVDAGSDASPVGYVW